jgi:hypothetical protein
MTAAAEKNQVTDGQYPVSDKLLIGAEQIDFDFAFANQEHLLGVEDLPDKQIVNMRADPVTGRVLHVGDLLREVGRREELNARFVIIGTDDQGNRFETVGDGFNTFVTHRDQYLLFGRVVVYDAIFWQRL